MTATVYRSLVDNAPDPIVVCDAEWRITYVNPSATQRFGWELAELHGKGLVDLCVDVAATAEARVTLRAGGGEQFLFLRGMDGSVSPMVARAAAIETDDGASAFALYLREPQQGDTESALLEQVLTLRASLQGYREIALSDPLTRLPNRRAVEEALMRECARGARRGTPVSVLLLDLDRFKQINDRHGHAAGDLALRRYAALLQKLSRESELLGRLGGDEFLLVLSAWAPEAWRCAERLRAAVEQEVLNPSWCRCTLSIGIASSERPIPRCGPALVAQADVALYRAKRAGGNCVRIAPVEESGSRKREAG